MYEQHINASVTGIEQVERLSSANDQLAERTKRLSQVIADRIAGDEKLIGKQLELARSETVLEQLREKHRIQTEALTASTNKHAAAQENLNSAVRRSVSDIQAASGVFRAMEGALPIRAVEQFTTKILGMGPALQALFPAVGAIALAGVLEKAVTKVGELYNAWNPVLTAQEKSLQILRDSNREFDGLIKKSNQYRLDAYERAHGRTARLRLEADESTGDAKYNDQARIAYIQGQIAKQQAIVNAPSGTIIGTPGMMGGSPVVVTGPSALARRTAQETLVGLDGQLEEAQQQQRVDLLHATDLRAKASQIDNKSGARAENTAIEIRKRATEAMMRSYFGGSLEGKGAYDQVRLRMEEEDAVRRDPTRAQNIRASYTLFRAAANGEKNDAISKRDMDLGASLDTVSGSSLQHMLRLDLAQARHDLPELQALIHPMAITPPPGWRSGAQELRDVRDNERRYMGIAGVSAQLSGQSQGDQIQSQYGARIRFANQELAAQLRIADAKKDINAREDALDQAQQKRYDAALEREKALMEIALRQKESFQNAAVGLVRAAQSGNIGGFLKGQAAGLGDKIVGNLAGMAWPEIEKIIPHASGGLGKILQGTPFGPDPLKTAGVSLNTAGAKLSAAADKLMAAGGIRVGGGGGGSSGGGAWDPFGAGSNGDYNASGGGAWDPFGAGSNGDYPGGATSTGGGGISGLARGVGIAGALGAGAFGIYSGISQGGARGGLTAAGSALGMVGAVLPLISKSLAVAGPIGMAAGMALGLVTTLMGDPKAARENAINKQLATSQFLAPASVNASMSTGGTYADYDRFGNVRSSSLSPFPTVQQGFFDYRNGVTVQGRTVNQFSGGAAPTVVLQVSAMDSKSIIDRHQDISDAVLRALDTGSGRPLAERLRGN